MAAVRAFFNRLGEKTFGSSVIKRGIYLAGLNYLRGQTFIGRDSKTGQ